MQPEVYQKLYQRLVGQLWSLLERFVEMLPNTVVAVALLLLFWVASLLAATLTKRGLRQIHADPAAGRLVVTLVRLAVLGTGLFGALDLLHLDKALTSLLAGAGIIGLALGFAFQDLASNLISGVGLAIARKRAFQLGDVVETNGFIGMVEHVGLRVTYLGTIDGKTIVMPNRHIYQNTLVNLSASGRRRVDFTLAVDRFADLPRAAEAALAALHTIEPRRPDPPPRVYFKRFSDSAIELTCWLWIDFRDLEDIFRAEHAGVIALQTAFREAGIVLPFPIRTLHVREPGESARLSPSPAPPGAVVTFES